MVECSGEGFDRFPPVISAEERVPTRLHTTTRVEQIVAQHDVLARDVRLVEAATVIATDDARVGGRPLGPVDPVAFDGELLRRVVACRQADDERRDLPGFGVHEHDA